MARGRFMAERDYRSAPVAEFLGLASIIDGLASDLQDLRSGHITPADGLARAAVAKQLFNGVRLYLSAVSTVGRGAPHEDTAVPALKGGA